MYMTFMANVLQPIKSYLKKTIIIFMDILLEDYKIIYFPVVRVACSSIKKLFADFLRLKYDPDDIDDSMHELNLPFVIMDNILL